MNNRRTETRIACNNVIKTFYQLIPAQQTLELELINFSAMGFCCKSMPSAMLKTGDLLYYEDSHQLTRSVQVRWIQQDNEEENIIGLMIRSANEFVKTKPKKKKHIHKSLSIKNGVWGTDHSNPYIREAL